jgi:hypothetical protein
LWGYYPEANSSCPSPSCGISALKNFAGDHPDWVPIIMSQALKSFQAAYAKYGIQVTLATQSADFFGNLVPDQEFTVYVLGDYPFLSSGKLYSDTASVVYYYALMEGAQEALGQPEIPSTGAGWLNYSPSYPPQDQISFVNLLRAMGTAIGNASAHEIGHHLERITTIKSNGLQGLPFMDCGLGNPGDANRPVPIACQGNDNFVYGFYNSGGHPQYGAPTDTGGMFFYGIPGGTPGVPVQPAIQWGTADICWLQNYTNPGICKQQ